jgi:hypothetical protein
MLELLLLIIIKLRSLKSVVSEFKMYSSIYYLQTTFPGRCFSFNSTVTDIFLYERKLSQTFIHDDGDELEHHGKTYTKNCI